MPLKTSPVVRNAGKDNPLWSQVQERWEKYFSTWAKAGGYMNGDERLRLMMACCLPHAGATLEAVQAVLDLVVLHPDAIRVYDYPLVEE